MERRVQRRHRPQPARGGPVPVPQSSSRGALPDQEAHPAVPAEVLVVGGVRGAGELPVQPVHHVRQPARPIAVLGGQPLERHGFQRGRQRWQGGPAPRLPEQPPDRDPRQHPAAGVHPVRDRLQGVRAHAPGGDAAVERVVRSRYRSATRIHVAARLRPVHERGPDARGLDIRLHEQHGQEPETLTDHGGGEPDQPARCPIGSGGPIPGRGEGDPEPVRIRGQRVGQQPPQRPQVIGHRWQPEARLVVLEAGLPGPDARVEIVIPARPVGEGSGRAHGLRRPRRPQRAAVPWPRAPARPA